MNDTEKRIAIAEACGMVGPFATQEEPWSNEGGGGVAMVTRDARYQEVPDYLNDLNAMHEAEATIRGDARWQTYKKELRDICDSAYPCEDPYHAPAKLRAEAFLMTIKHTAPKL